MADDPKILGTAMTAMYGEAAEGEARNCAYSRRDVGKMQDYVLWIEVVDIIAQRENFL